MRSKRPSSAAAATTNEPGAAAGSLLASAGEIDQDQAARRRVTARVIEGDGRPHRVADQHRRFTQMLDRVRDLADIVGERGMRAEAHSPARPAVSAQVDGMGAVAP